VTLRRLFAVFMLVVAVNLVVRRSD
jgi:hypothetical protein